MNKKQFDVFQFHVTLIGEDRNEDEPYYSNLTKFVTSSSNTLSSDPFVLLENCVPQENVALKSFVLALSGCLKLILTEVRETKTKVKQRMERGSVVQKEIRFNFKLPLTLVQEVEELEKGLEDSVQQQQIFTQILVSLGGNIESITLVSRFINSLMTDQTAVKFSLFLTQDKIRFLSFTNIVCCIVDAVRINRGDKNISIECIMRDLHMAINLKDEKKRQKFMEEVMQRVAEDGGDDENTDDGSYVYEDTHFKK